METHKIIVRTTCIIVTNYTFGECPKLEDCFKLYNMVTHSYWYLGLKYDEERKYLYLPRGIDLWYVQNCFGIATQDLIYTEPSEYGYIQPCELKFPPRDEEQKEAIRFTTGIGEYCTNKNSPQLSLNLNTGKGKTYVSVFTMMASRIKSVVVATIKDWLYQWRDAILEYTTMAPDRICVINGSGDINMLLSGKSRNVDCDIYLVTHSTIKSYGDTYGWSKISKLFELLKIGNMFVDEAHKNFDNICNLNYAVNVAKTYFVTATPARSDEYENRIYQLSIKNIPSIDLFKEDSDPHTAYIALKYNSKPTAEQVSDCRNIYGLDRNKYVNYVVHQPEFHKMLHVVMSMVKKADHGPERFLFYVGTNNGILVVKDWLERNYPETRGQIGIYTTLSPNKEKEKHKKYLLSTTKSAGEAADFRGLKIAFVLAEPFKSEVLARQTLGRTRASNTLYVELVDVAFKKIKEFYYSKLPIFNRYATSTKSVNLSTMELEERYNKTIEYREKQREYWKERLLNEPIYSPFTYMDPHTPFTQLPDMKGLD